MAKSFEMKTNLQGPSAYSGYIQGISDVVKTDLFIGSAVELIHSGMAQKLNLYVDALAITNKDAYQHVYEWPSSFQGGDTIGQPGSRLWIHTLVGRGRNKIAGFQFLPSTVPTPVDPRLLEDDHHVNEGVHIFTWKAPVFEYAMNVIVQPKLSKTLAYFPKSGNFVATKKASRFVAGSGNNERVFTTAFLSWWKLQSGKEFARSGLKEKFEKEIGSQRELEKVATKAAAKAFSISSSRDTQKEFNKARAKAKIDMMRKRGRFIDEAAARRLLLYGY